MNDAVIEVKNLVKKYNNFTAVDNVSFNVYRGEIFSLLGPNGAGKTTTINILTTLIPPTSGEAYIAGIDVVKNPKEVRHKIGITFQEMVLDRDLTVWETLEFHGWLYGIPKSERRKKIEELLEIVGLSEKRNALIKTLSGGMKRKLEIIRGLMNNPEVLFLDEPTLGLDPQSRMIIWDQIRRINKEGVTVFMTTHYMDEAERLSDKVAIMDQGKIAALDTPENLKNKLGRDVVYLKLDTHLREHARHLILQTINHGIKEIKDIEDGITVTLQGDVSEIVPKLFKVLNAAGITIHSFNLKRPVLDDVFIYYTGRKMRDGKADMRNNHPRGRAHLFRR
ncbi:MAG: ATP-binding cassette domain-containing protein [Candidatus Odinarchaeia archaeon]